MRWYMVPVRLDCSVLRTSPLCFQSCGEKGMVFHIQWQCPKVRHFWIHVYHFIYPGQLAKVTKTSIIGQPGGELPETF